MLFCPFAFSQGQENIDTVSVPSQESVDTSVDSVENSEQESLISSGDNIQKEETYTNTFKQPVSKKKIALKFVIAMLCVGLSSFLIYVGLTLYNRIREGFAEQSYTNPENETSLTTPDNLQQAIKTFIEKTNWK